MLDQDVGSTNGQLIYADYPSTRQLIYLDYPYHATAPLILSTVHLMRLLTVATEPRESFAVGTESTRIWKATVSSDPPDPISGFNPPLPGGPSGRMAKPDGKRAT
nr:hypothetical protein ACMD2_04154 [Ipomoea batatas]GMD11402.1 hypothetical protein ACMD2_04154 [Ipomoea batatas]